MMIKNYLQDQLQNCSKYELTKEDKKKITNHGMAEYIYGKLTSKKFRKYAMDEDAEIRTKGAIEIAISENKSLPVEFFMGAYKLWRLEESTPYPDWAEFFNMAYLISYVAPIMAAYEPGVDLIYYMHTLLMEVHDNLSTEEINKYIKNFDSLLKKFEKYLPKNIKIKIDKDANYYPREEYFEILESNFDEGKKIFNAFSDEKKEQRKKHGKLNIKWDGVKDWSLLSEIQKEEKIVTGIIYGTVASNFLPKIKDVTRADDKVTIFTKSGGGFIGVGSCKTSIAKFWVGTGVLEYDKVKNKYYPRVLSPSQFQNIRDDLKKIESNIIDLENFEDVYLYDGRMRFG